MDDDLLKKLIGKMMPLLDERNRRLFLGILADCLGRGSVTKLNQITKVSRVTIAQGQKESIELSINPEARPSIIDAVGGTRTPGGGRKKLEILKKNYSNFLMAIQLVIRKIHCAGQLKVYEILQMNLKKWG